jgi:hypothetical protein
VSYGGVKIMAAAKAYGGENNIGRISESESIWRA